MFRFGHREFAAFLLAFWAWAGMGSPVVLAVEKQLPTFEATKAAFESAADRIDTLDPSDWLYDRFSPARPGLYDLHTLPALEMGPPPAVAQRIGALEKLLNQDHAISVVVPLLKHESPQVRSLAIVYLFSTENPRVLPHLVALADDKALTFPRPVQFAADPFSSPRKPPLPLPQTVGEVAQRAVDCYLEAAGYGYGIAGSRNNPGFDHYWRLRRDRDWCLSWFAVRLRRATQATTPVPGRRMDRVRAVRRQIDQVPEPDRTFILMALVQEWLEGNGSDAFITEAAMVDEAKQIDSDVWMAVLRQNLPSSDPDLQRSRQARFIEPIAVFILTHATDLLDPKHAEELLQLSQIWEQAARAGETSGGMIHRWIIAAARLQPKTGIEWLKASYKLFDQRFKRDRQAQLSIALWDIDGRAQIPFLVDWFYSQPVETNIYPNSRSQFIQEVTRAREWVLDEHGEKRRTKHIRLQGLAGENVKQLVATIIRDPRFGELDYYSIRELFITVNLWFEEPLVTIKRLYDLHSSPPGGVAAFYRDREAVEKKYPVEVTKFQETLSDWRTILRLSVQTWLPTG